MGTLGSIMDKGHTTGPVVAGVVSSSFGIGYSFIGAATNWIRVSDWGNTKNNPGNSITMKRR